jgi:hypothetical protein
MKFASVTSDAFFNVLKSAKKNSIQCPSEKSRNIFKELGKLNSMTMTEPVKISTKFALAF